MDRNILWNGVIVAEEDFRIMPSADWFRFAPGFYESIKASHGRILFWKEHYERLTRGAAYWNVDLPDPEILLEELKDLIEKSKHNSGKLRIQFGVNVADSSVDYFAILENGEAGYPINETGWKVDVYKDHFKLISTDSNHKSNRRDIYLLALQWSIKNQLNDALVINQTGHVADSTICNFFWLENGRWYTPPLHSSCIPGVMRQFLMSQDEIWDFHVREEDVFPQRLLKAEELFLTNAIRGIRWVEYLGDQKLGNARTLELAIKLSEWEKGLTS